MKDTTFFLNDDQKKRLVRAYKNKKNKLVDVTGSKEDLYGVMRMEPYSFEAGCGGLYSTAEDYERFAEMLLNEGMLDGIQLLKKETVEMIYTEANSQHVYTEPGLVWGLGVKIRQNPKEAGSYATEGTYGWSGAFGTHFFVSPKDNLDAVFMTNRTDLDGAGSYISKKIEEMVFGNWRK